MNPINTLLFPVKGKNQLLMIHNLFLLSTFFLLPTLLSSQSIFINEFMASNNSVIADDNGDFDDWVEFYNPGNTDMNIGGMYLSDDLTNLTKRIIPANDPSATTVPAGGFLLLWFDGEPLQGTTHIDLKLSAAGEDIVLVASDGITIIDSYTFGQQTANLSEGRTTDGGTSWDFFGDPTPGETNGTPTGSTQTQMPVADVSGGLYNSSVTVSLSSATPGATIHYTLDGSIPTENSPEHTSPLQITSITPLRAIAYSAVLLPSQVMTETYLIDVNHTFAIIALNTEPDYLFDSEIGIFENISEEIEHPAHVQFFEPDGTLGFSQDIEIEKHGAATLTLGQKSLKLKAKASLGNEYINYPIFPDLPFDTYRGVVIRQSGQDWKKSNFRDAMMQSLVGDLSDVGDIIDEPDLDVQGFRPSVVYINGEYWGIYNIREQMNWRYVDTHYGIDKEDLDVVEDKDFADDGDMLEWDAFTSFLENTNFSNDADYQTLQEKVDVDHFMDYLLHGIYLDNNDWPGNNNKKWRERSADGTWRFMTKDLDFGFGLRPLNGSWNSGDYTTNMLAVCLDANSSEYYNPPHSTLFLRRLMENASAKANFSNRAADLLNTLFEPNRVVARIDAFETLYTPEYQQHLDRWNGGWNQHAEEVEVLRYFANGRVGETREHFVDQFSEISGLTEVTISANPTNGGNLYFSTINLTEQHFPWTGTYFQGLDIPVLAKANQGYVLTGWSDSSLGLETEVTVNYATSSNSLTANFELGSVATDSIVINEINYNSPDFPNSGDWVELYNPNPTAVDISGWYFEDESGDYFGLPANTLMAPGSYLLLVEDRTEFFTIYPSAQHVYGGFGDNPGGFKLSNKGELITLKNANGVLIDEVAYEDDSPWPNAPDGDGPTLQLIAPALNNSLPVSWMPYQATPGSLNGEVPSPQDQAILFPEIMDQLTFAPPISLMATATSGLPVSYNVISGPATVSGNTLTLDGTTGTVVVQANQTGDNGYNPATSVEQSFLVSIFTVGPETYCESEGTAPWQEYITNVTFGNIDHDSGKDKYGDFITFGTYVDQGLIYPISITPDFSYEPYDDYYSVWIDYNQDNDFDDADELVFSVFDDTFGPIEGDITIPGTATAGATRMRIAMKRDGFAHPCETFAKGEVEDYTIIIEEVIGNNGVLNLGCLENIFVDITPGTTSTPISWPEPGVSTTCPAGGATATLVAPVNIPNGGDFPLGTTTVIYEATDDCGNVETCIFTITVTVDNGSLDFFCPDDIIVDALPGATSANVNWNDPLATTTCAIGDILFEQISGFDNGAAFPIGNTMVTYSAKDECGNTESCSFNVIVNPVPSSPQITCPQDIFVTLPVGATSENINWIAPVGVSDCVLGASQTLQVQGPDSGSTFSSGVYTIEYETTDACGEKTDCSFTITVTGNNPNTITLDCPADQTILIPLGTTTIVNWPLPIVTSTCQGGAGNPNCGTNIPGFNLIGTYNNHEYYISENQQKWMDGLGICTTFGASPATISDAAENDFIQSQIPNSAFIGLNDATTEGDLIWNNGEPFGYVNFSSNSQNTSSKDYAKLQALDGKWKMHSGNYKRYMLMEMNCTGAANLTLTQTGGPDNGSELGPGTYNITYEATDDCGDVQLCNITVTVEEDTGPGGGGDYCEAEGTAPWNQHIGQVIFHTIDHDSGKDGYGDFTDISTTVDPGSSYVFTLIPEFSWSYWDEYIRVWIDFNQDSDFNDPEELVLEEISVAGTPDNPPTIVDIINGTIAIPETALSGTTRMRVAMKKEAFAGPCEIFEFGEVEDYEIEVTYNGSNLEGANEFLFFNAVKTGREVNLNWVTNTEYKNDYFVIEHSLNGIIFEALLTKVSLYQTDLERNYEELDEEPYPGANYYRVKQVFTDGSYRYSNVRKVNFDLNLTGFELFPVPTEGKFYINLKSYVDLPADIQIVNALGETVLRQHFEQLPDELLPFDLRGQKAGVYFLSAKVEGHRMMTKRVVLVRK